MLRRFLIGAMAVAGTLVTATASSAQPAPPPQPAGSIGIRLLEAPVSREGDPRARIYVVDHVAPGTTISRKIEVLNATAENQTVNLYVGSAVIHDGQFVADDAPGPSDLKAWTSVSPNQFAMAPFQRQVATVTVATAPDAHDGERYGVIWAERGAPDGSGIRVLNRVGIRMYLSVGTGTEPPSDFVIESLTPERNGRTRQPSVRALVRNTGARALDLSGKLDLRDGPGGLTAGPFPADLGTTLAPRQHEYVRVTLDPRIPAGPWDAVITLRSGVVEKTAHAHITFPNEGIGRASKASALGRSLRVVLPLAAILVALIVGIVLAVRRRRDKYAEIKRDLRQFEKLVRAQASGSQPVPTGRDDPATAIRAAITQAGRAGDKETAAKLQAKLDELLAIRAASATEAEPATESAPSGALAAILQELATAPEARRDALVRAARAYGQPELQQHAAVIDELPEDIRMKLFRPTKARKPNTKPSVKPPSSKTRP